MKKLRRIDLYKGIDIKLNKLLGNSWRRKSHTQINIRSFLQLYNITISPMRLIRILSLYRSLYLGCHLK